MAGKKLVVGITQGDGNGIGYEVIIKALADGDNVCKDLVQVMFCTGLSVDTQIVAG